MKQGTLDLLKFLALQRVLSESKRGTAGLLELLWYGTAKNAPQGDIGKFSNIEIALLVDWPGSPDALIDALVQTRWLDECPKHRLVIHDWADHCPTWVRGNLARYSREFVNSTKHPTKQPTKQAAKGGRASCEGGARNLLPSQANSNQSNPSQSRSMSAEPTHPPIELVDFVIRFNDVAERYEIPKTELPPSKKVVSLWRSAMAVEQKKAALAEFDKIATAIRDSEFVHGKAAFNLFGLLSSNSKGESKLLKLLNGDYRNGKSDRCQITNRAGDVSHYSQSKWE